MSKPDFLSDAIRSIFAFLDSVGYLLLTAVYKIFFTVANAQILDGEVMIEFFNRIQLILGIFMTFKLAMTAINIIINPEAFKDKEKGASKLLMRIAISLVLLTLIVPLTNIPENSDSDLDEQIRTNGVLFGFLNQFQYAVLQDNILGKLILGSTADSNEGNYGDLDNLSDIGMTLSTTVAQAFISPTLKENVEVQYGEDGRISENSVACPVVLNDYEYGLPKTSYKDYIKYINDTCDSDSKEVYIFEYTPFAGLVCSLIMTVIIIGFTLDVAVRAIKLAILRLVAPIPIISYISPGQEKDGAFGNWVKTLTSTYIDLFLRLTIIYFGAYVILIISEGGITIWQNTPDVFTSLFSSVFIMIGVLVFMKQAPKFFQDMLGLKGDGKLFSGIGTMLGAAALTGGLAGSVVTGARAAWEENKMAKRPAWMGIGGAITSGLTSGLGGAWAGGKALLTSDKKVPSSVMAAMQKRNAMRASHSTLPGRISSGAFGMFTGRTLAERDQAILDLNKTAASEAKNLKGLIEEEALKFGDYGEITLRDGTVGQFNYSDLSAAMQSKDTNGNFKYNGRDYNVSMFGNNEMEAIKKAQAIRYTQGHVAAGVEDKDKYINNGKIRSQKRTTDYAFSQAGGNAAETYGDGDYKNLGASIGAATEATTDMSTNIRNIKHRANHNANKNS